MGKVRTFKISTRALSRLGEKYVEHLKCYEESILLSKFLENELKISSNRAYELITLGSIYFSSNNDQQQPSRRLMNDQQISSGDYVRVYLNTTRYDVRSIPWQETIVHNSSEFIVINKPAGLSTQPSVGNYKENVSECIRAHLGLEKIFVPHRLDSDTSGLVIFGKTLPFAQKFAKISFEKTYRSLLSWRGDAEHPVEVVDGRGFVISSLPSVGTTITHYMENRKAHPRFLHQDPIENSKLCQCILTKRSPVVSGTTSQWKERIQKLQGSNLRLALALQDWIFPFETVFDYLQATRTEKYLNPPHLSSSSPHNERVSFCEVELKLLTGRTHQLRAQMQALGGGIQIAGDRIYHTNLPGALPPPQSRQQIRPQFVSSPHLALQACSISSDGSQLLDSKRFQLQEAFWSSLFDDSLLTS